MQKNRIVALLLAVTIFASMFGLVTLNTSAATTITLGHASISENGTVNGQPGDQTGNEVCTRTWQEGTAGYWHTVIRANDPNVAEKIATAMRKACDNNNIGYGQSDRLSLYTKAQAKNWDLSKITEKCNTDCSALVAVCVNAAGISVSGSMTTYNEVQVLSNTGKFEIIKTNSSNNLKRGDIVLSNDHTAVVLSGELPMPKLSYPMLQYGDSGVEVSMVQTMLKTLYYPDLGTGGAFYSYTKECVVNFQKMVFPNNSSEWDGIVGPKTWNALITRYKSAVMLQYGNEGYNVEMLQRMLKVLHYPSLGIGNFGDYTKECVINFQKTAFPNNSSEWDGVVGPKTWEKLFAAYFSRPYSSNYPLLKYGDYGMGVMMVQTMLKTLYYPNLGFGIFGNYTRECVTNFQKKMFPNNSSEWDGIVGQKTWSSLINMYKNTVVLQYGSKGNDVLMLQKMLQVIGYSKLGTGGFGNYTKECVIDFQKKAFPNDSSKWDGVVGPETWAKLFAAYFPNYYKTVS